MRGQGDAQSIKIYADAYSKDPSFFAFYRSLQAYRDSLPGKNTTLVLSPHAEFFKYLEDGPSAAAPNAKEGVAPNHGARR